jgi:N-acetylglutamate synthase-like GNAT family acetyltransferase
MDGIMIRIRKALPGDLPHILDLVVASGLVVEGISENLARFLVAAEGGRILATAGLEMGDGCAHLRSVAVRPELRGQGIGVEIVRQALRMASLSGAGTVYLLTTGAAEFFAKFGFKPALRAEVDAEFPDSAVTRPDGICASATPMALRDLSRVLEPHPRKA